MKLKHSLIILILLTCSSFIVFYASAEVVIPEKPFNHVVDLAGIIDDNTEANLNGYLLELEQKTTAQMVVLTIKSLDGASIEDFAIRTARDKWKLGQKGKDNGVLLLVSLQDRKYRFEIGYGLEGVIPDSFAASIGRESLVPYFKKGDYSTGILTASLAAIKAIADNARVEITGKPNLESHSFYPHSAEQQRMPTRSEPQASYSDKQAFGVCGTLCGSFIFIIIAVFVLNIALLVWVAKDAKNRGMGSSVGWIFLILFTGVIGLIIYLFSRPKGELVICDVCKNKKFKVKNICPHCGNSSSSVAMKTDISRRPQSQFCKQCGKQATPDSLFCSSCGGKMGE